MLTGVLLAFGSYWGILLLIPFVLLMNWLVIRHEEAYLGEKFGEAYAVFKSRVRRWL
jgi:protein-S-isoprenylcysteine O-methyltransferase Ste14